ncbi:hypothetical protein PM082_019790 [Marasmius tenuissimus]|nr:hypothetical protein PM082_019790 [Marasmius tenuissimus]
MHDRDLHFSCERKGEYSTYNPREIFVTFDASLIYPSSPIKDSQRSFIDGDELGQDSVNSLATNCLLGTYLADHFGVNWLNVADSFARYSSAPQTGYKSGKVPFARAKLSTYILLTVKLQSPLLMRVRSL